MDKVNPQPVPASPQVEPPSGNSTVEGVCSSCHKAFDSKKGIVRSDCQQKHLYHLDCITQVFRESKKRNCTICDERAIPLVRHPETEWLMEETSEYCKSLPENVVSFKSAQELITLLKKHPGLVRKSFPTIVCQGLSSTLLHWAAAKGSVEKIQILLKSSAEIEAEMIGGVNSKGFSLAGLTPLYSAAEKGQVDAVEFLLSHGAKINASVNTGKSCGWQPLHIAAQKGHVKVINALLKAGADISAHDSRNITPLIAAAITGQLEAVQFLVANGADIDALTNGNRTALYLASENGNKILVEGLMELGADPEKILCAKQKISTKAVFFLKDICSEMASRHVKEFSAGGRECLERMKLDRDVIMMFAIRHNVPEAVTWAKGNGASVTGALLIAANLWDEDAVKTIAAICSEPSEALAMSVQNKGHSEEMALLKKYGANENRALLILSMQETENYGVAVRRLLDAGANVNEALLYAADCQPEIEERVLKKILMLEGANLETALQMARDRNVHPTTIARLSKLQVSDSTPADDNSDSEDDFPGYSCIIS